MYINMFIYIYVYSSYKNCVLEADASHFEADASLVFTKMYLFHVISNLILYGLYFTTY